MTSQSQSVSFGSLPKPIQAALEETEFRAGEKIASGFVESAINQVVSKRMVKKQQMGWSQRGAHLLLQIRTRVLDQEWENTFRRWYPDFRPQGQAKKAA